MKKVILLLLMITFLQCTYNTSYYHNYETLGQLMINEEIGDVINSEEREKYDLFKRIQGFISATLYGLPDAGYETHIETTDKELRAVTRTPLAIEILRDYIDRYEEIREDKTAFERDWQIVTYDDLGQPITRVELKRVGTPATNGCGYGCCLLGSVSTGLIGVYIFDPEGDAYNVVSTLCGAPGGLIGSAAGAYIGGEIDNKKAIEAIKKARKPF